MQPAAISVTRQPDPPAAPGHELASSLMRPPIIVRVDARLRPCTVLQIDRADLRDPRMPMEVRAMHHAQIIARQLLGTIAEEIAPQVFKILQDAAKPYPQPAPEPIEPGPTPSLDDVTLAAWEAWTGNGLNQDADEKEQTILIARGTAEAAYRTGMTDVEWFKATMAKLA